MTPQQYEAFRESMLNLEDELAELDYETNPEATVAFVNQLINIVRDHNST